MSAAPLPITDVVLDNGLRLLVAPDGAVPAVSTVLTYNVGARHERAGQRELAHLFEHLMFQGSAHVAKGEHMQLIIGAGGIPNAMTASDYTTYFQTVPSQQLELPLWLEAERLANLHITQEGLDNQRDVVWNEHRQRRENVPYGSASDNLRERLFPPGHCYHTSVEAHADLAATTLDAVQEFFGTYYAPNNGVLAVVGDCDADSVVELAGRYLGAVPPLEQIPPPPDVAPPALDAEVSETIVSAVPLPRLYLGWLAPSAPAESSVAVELLTLVLGAGQAARLRQRLVLEWEVATEAAIGWQSLVGGASVVVAQATGRADVELAALRAAMDKALDEVVRDGISKGELDRAKAQARRQHLATTSRQLLQGLDLTVQGAVHRDPYRSERRLQEVLSTPAEAVRQAAVDVLATPGRVSLEYVPEGR